MTTINQYFQNSDPDIARRLGRIEKALTQLLGDVEAMALDLNLLEQESAAETDALTAIEEFITKFGDAVLAEGPNQARINAVVQTMVANRTRMAKAILTGTPADPALPPA